MNRSVTRESYGRIVQSSYSYYTFLQIPLKNTEPIEALWYLTILKYTETFSASLFPKKKKKKEKRWNAFITMQTEQSIKQNRAIGAVVGWAAQVEQPNEFFET